MEYIYQATENAKWTFVLLHGTGGDETNLIPIAKEISDSANILSVRGNVNENGALRYFKRKAEGLYDLEDLAFRSQELVDFITSMSEEKGFDLNKVIFVGFSNGSNIALNILIHFAKTFNKGILFAPLYPMAIEEDKDLSNHQLFLSMGKADPICSMQANNELIEKLNHVGANLSIEWVHTHQITPQILTDARQWVEELD
ncbi:alpha/beta hydrolase [Facklamia miroungae]|uniref:Phospholipase/carboxylesterase n=1 Tax=Facklamia miroungae TaxID=120956 RepID=A0A1G7QGQ7_9LACT|nr:alpha/beta hydrolase [Facklamia miroungae]NKZ28935.1 alpha/beta hydrolase [Facklamia miroungae]SDF97701.1 phospholipase/carboxylesterase [Facklamia miroungae]